MLWESLDEFIGVVQRRFNESKVVFKDIVGELKECRTFKDVSKVLQKVPDVITEWLFTEDKLMILGPFGAGKTSLIEYLHSGYPRKAVVKDHLKTGGIVNADRKVKIAKSGWHEIEIDIGGDPIYRELWAQAVQEKDPYALIYVLDGRASVDTVLQDMKNCLHDSLSTYDTSSNLKLIFMFVNFCDIWQKDKDKLTLREQVALEARTELLNSPLLTAISEQIRLDRVKLETAPTHINPDANSWQQLEDALSNFSTAFLTAHGKNENGEDK